MLLGCSNEKYDTRLLRIAETVSKYPHDALASLDSIDYAKLSDMDKHYFDLLSVKARDKAFIYHTSDSLILKVIEYESHNKNHGKYAEALYYGGRVYDDLGDLPTAINYYHSALDNLTDNKEDEALRRCILSQISGILHSLRLHRQAIPYSKKLVDLDSIKKDSINYVYDAELLAHIYINSAKYDSAEYYLNKARIVAKELHTIDTVTHNLYLGLIKYNIGEIEEALKLIRHSILNIDSLSRSEALSIACKVYAKAGIRDTAAMYANELIHRKNTFNRKTGYQLLLSDEMKSYIPADSIIPYVFNYRDIIEAYLNQNGNQAAIIQDSFFNYQLHYRERLKSEKANKRLFYWLGTFIILILILSIYLLYLKNKNKSQLLKLHESINNVNSLRRILANSAGNDKNLLSADEERPMSESIKSDKSFSPSIQDLREKLREDLFSLSKLKEHGYVVASEILGSQAYEKISQYIDTRNILSDNSPFWKELEETILKSSPQFKHRLNLLTGGRLKPSDYHLALLIKCGISPTNIAQLVGRAKSTITYRKDALGTKILGEKLEIGVIDNIIHLL